jgi:FKBP-type peptidyl-prolyl cis-trans isomerase FkpA
MRKPNSIWTVLVATALAAGAARYCQGAVEPGPDDKDAPQEFTPTKSGLHYRVLRKSGGRHPTAQDTITVHYKGWLDSGKEFDNSYKREDPTTFALSEVIAGWTEGLQLIGEGGKIELLIPSHIGYGTRGMASGGIPGNATLHFVVELIRIK